jgi:hypothetical protein
VRHRRRAVCHRRAPRGHSPRCRVRTADLREEVGNPVAVVVDPQAYADNEIETPPPNKPGPPAEPVTLPKVSLHELPKRSSSSVVLPSFGRRRNRNACVGGSGRSPATPRHDLIRQTTILYDLIPLMVAHALFASIGFPLLVQPSRSLRRFKSCPRNHRCLRYRRRRTRRVAFRVSDAISQRSGVAPPHNPISRPLEMKQPAVSDGDRSRRFRLGFFSSLPARSGKGSLRKSAMRFWGAS